MLSRTFNLNPVSRITKEKHKLVNPKIFIPQFNGKLNSGKVLEIEIEIPKGYGFLDDITTFGDFLEHVDYGRKHYGIKEEVYQVSQLTSDKVKMRGGKGGVSSGNSIGQVVTASFLTKSDVHHLMNLETLIPKPMSLNRARALSRLASTVKRCGFLTDDDGVLGYFREYYRETLPMFNILNIKEHSDFHFTHMKHILVG